ncbi:hypothetical protein Ae201684_005138 [Aphanomyces euteiches]|uniref:Uncharacterized protein n=1 Tax=Aphanomyces euteiches TaxID=100861 RepID=A0A6G0XG42_9STRA|nr:hypothetical protein Ae201684_005138 [Aphanomyces euteiches]
MGIHLFESQTASGRFQACVYALDCVEKQQSEHASTWTTSNSNGSNPRSRRCGNAAGEPTDVRRRWSVIHVLFLDNNHPDAHVCNKMPISPDDMTRIRQ